MKNITIIFAVISILLGLIGGGMKIFAADENAGNIYLIISSICTFLTVVLLIVLLLKNKSKPSSQY